MSLPFFGQARIPEAIEVFTVDLSGDVPSQWTVQAAHIRNLLNLAVASGPYDMDTGNVIPFETIAPFFNFEFSKQQGGGASLFSRALNIAQERESSLLTTYWSESTISS